MESEKRIKDEASQILMKEIQENLHIVLLLL